ncbi:MAG: hypothetical protein ACI92G_002215 [Candidatus Pelagisphaera sp.]|jgi:hypothetical protein
MSASHPNELISVPHYQTTQKKEKMDASEADSTQTQPTLSYIFRLPQLILNTLTNANKAFEAMPVTLRSTGIAST